MKFKVLRSCPVHHGHGEQIILEKPLMCQRTCSYFLIP